MRRAEFRRRDIQHGIDALNRRVASKRPRAAEHLVKHTAKRKNIRAMIGRLAAHLLGRHVGGRAQEHARLGGIDGRLGVRSADADIREFTAGSSLCADVGIRAPQLRQTEIQNLHPASLVTKIFSGFRSR